MCLSPRITICYSGNLITVIHPLVQVITVQLSYNYIYTYEYVFSGSIKSSTELNIYKLIESLLTLI